MKRWREGLPLAALCLWAAGRAGAAETVPLTWEDLPGLVGRNRNVAGAGGLLEAARSRTGHAGRSFLPAVTLEGGQERFTTGRHDRQSQPYGAAEAQVNLFRGGRDSAEETVRRAQVEASSASAAEVYRRDLAEARRLYWSLVFDREMLKTLTEALAENGKLLAGANRRVQRGLAADTDRLEFEMHELQLKEEIESLAHEVILLQIGLAPLVGLSPETTFETPTTLPHDHDDDMLSVEAVPEVAPEVAGLRAQSAMARAQGTAAERAWTPALDVYGGYSLHTLRDRDFPARKDRDDTVAGVRVSLDVFNGGRARNEATALARQSKAYAEQARHRAESWEAGLRVAKEDLKHHHELLHSSEEQIALSRKYLSRTQDEYDRGVKNSPDVLGALQKHFGLRRQYAERRRDYQMVRTALLERIGR